MAEYQFSRRAALDVEAIAEYTIERVGLEQAHSYRDDLGACFERLAEARFVTQIRARSSIG